MYMAKLLVVIGNFVLTGSFWFVPMFVYLALETATSISREEKYLAAAFPMYAGYQKKTKRLIPFVF